MIANLQVLRGLAALVVVFHHALTHFYAMGLKWLPFEWVAHYGFVGVDVFFVLSGVVMAITTEKLSPGLGSGVHFLKRRLLRIYLGYWPIFLIALGVLLFFTPERMNDVNWIGSLLLTSTRLNELLIPPSWSLTYELFFYALIGWSLLTKNSVLWFMLLTVLILVKVNVMAFGESQFLDIVLSPFLFEFLMGFYLWRLKTTIINSRIQLVVLVIGILSLLSGVYLATENSTWRVFTFGVFAVCVVWLALYFEQPKRGSFYAVWVKLGGCSYTLYLLHTVLLVVFSQSYLRSWLIEHDYAVSGFVLLMGLIIVISWLFSELIEQPLYRWATVKRKASTTRC